MTKPLHIRIQESKKKGKEQLEHQEAIEKELNEFYRMAFETEAGQKVLEHLTYTYLSRFPRRDMNPNEIMFGYGQEFVIKEILRRIEIKE
jgi:hypothetical protein